jgi:hypothetical protein
MSKISDTLLSKFKEDADAKFPRYPASALHILSDRSAASKIEEKIKQEMKLLDVVDLGYDFYTGLISTCFKFASDGVGADPSDMLILTNGRCKVVAVVDPFDSEQPNPHVPPLPILPALPHDEDLPFAAARPSYSSAIPVDAERRYALQVRSEEFFQRLQMSSARESADTSCTYRTSRTTGRICLETTTVGPWPAPLVCDNWQEQEIIVTDTSQDDCPTD